VQHVSSINVVELLKHDYVIMPKTTVRWIELVFGEGLSAEEASQRIAEELDEEAGSDATAVDTVEAEELPEASDQDNDESDDEMAPPADDEEEQADGNH
jgi:large subunit ribosomal protein L4